MSDHPDRPGVPTLVVDPGVWVSALIGSASSPPAQLLDVVDQGRAVLVVSPALLEELREVLGRPKFRRWFSIADADQFVMALQLVSETREDPPTEASASWCRDPDDEYLVTLAASAGTTFLVSGDKDLLAVKRPGVIVVSPAGAVEALAYRHSWGPAFVEGTGDQAFAQAEAEGHGAVLAAAGAFLQIVAGVPGADEALAWVVTPESLEVWRRGLVQVRPSLSGRGMATRPQYPTADVAYVTLLPDPGDTIRATGEMLMADDVVLLSLQRRPELPGPAMLGGWRVHAVGDYWQPDKLPQVHDPQQ